MHLSLVPPAAREQNKPFNSVTAPKRLRATFMFPVSVKAFMVRPWRIRKARRPHLVLPVNQKLICVVPPASSTDPSNSRFPATPSTRHIQVARGGEAAQAAVALGVEDLSRIEMAGDQHPAIEQTHLGTIEAPVGPCCPWPQCLRCRRGRRDRKFRRCSDPQN